LYQTYSDIHVNLVGKIEKHSIFTTATKITLNKGTLLSGSEPNRGYKAFPAIEAILRL
jgi:hypothetical protein